jgi:hypothetical protein
MESRAIVWQDGEHVDCIDLTKKPYNAEIIKADHHKKMVLIHYSGLSKAFDEVLDYYSPRLLKQCKLLLIT